MNDIPKVSVILPFFNSQSTLLRAIQSITNQSFKDLEVLLIDNASSDDSRKIAEECAGKDSRIRVFSETKRGVVFAANRGFEESGGKYIARMDADDFSFPHRIEEQVQLLDSKDDIGLVAGLVKYAGDDRNKGFIHYVEWSNRIRTSLASLCP